MRKLLISLIVVVVVAVVGFGWLATQVYEHSTEATNKYDVTIAPWLHMAKNISEAINQHQLPPQNLSDWPTTDSISLSIVPITDLPLPSDLLQTLNNFEPIVLGSDTEIHVYYLLQNQSNLLLMSIPQALVLPDDNKVKLFLTLTFYLGVIVALLIWLYPLLMQLRRFEAAAVAFGQGKLNQRLPVSRWSYLQSIENEFNRMAAQINALLEDNKLLSRAVSHDLKTPLSRLRFGFEVLAETHDREKAKQYIERINQDINEMESLISRLLEYAKLEESHLQLNKVRLDVNALVLRLTEYYETDKNVHLKLAPQELKVFADSHFFKMLFNNIFGNALAHARSQVLIATYVQGPNVVLSIADDGNGIPKDERESILKPFIRGKTNKNANGHGMGLAIVARIASWHEATISIGKSKVLGGAEITIRFPMSDAG